MTGPADLHVGLQVDAQAGGERCWLKITVRLTNTGEQPVQPGIFASELLIDGHPDPSWRLALNGTMSPELSSLPPGRTAELTRELSLGGLTGEHEVSVRLGDHANPAVTISVG